MQRRHVLASSVVAAVAAAAPTMTPGGEANNDNDVVGSWFGTVTATDPPLGQFNDLISFHRDGVVTESRRYLVKPTPLGNLLETTGHGAWKKNGRTVEAFFRFIVESADTGVVLGTDNVRLSLTVDRATGRLTGTFVSQIKDTNDAVVFQASGNYSAKPISV